MARAGGTRPARVLLVIAVTVVAVGVAAAVWVVRGTDDSEPLAGASSQGVVGVVDDGAQAGGPLEAPPTNGYELPRSARPVRDFTDAFQVLTVDGDAPISLLGVESVGVDAVEAGRATMRLLDARLAGPGRTGNFQFFPRLDRLPRALGPLEDVEDATIGRTRRSRERGHTLVLSYRVEGTDPTARAGLRVHYESEGRRYVQDLPARIVSCGDLRQQECADLRDRLFPEG